VTAAHPELGPALSAAWRHARASRAELRAWQDARLRRLVRHAYESVSFYRRLFDRRRLHPRHIRGVVDLDLIPTTDKATMRAEGGPALLARGHDTASLLTVRTSGSTGEPFTIHRTWLEDKLQYLLRLRTFAAFGVRHRDRVVAVGVGGKPDSGDDKLIGRTLRALGLHNRELVDGLQEPARVAVQLREARPDVREPRLVGLAEVGEQLDWRLVLGCLQQQIAGFAYDAELCVNAERLGLGVSEVPVRWVNNEDTRVTLFGSSLQMALDLLRIAWRARRLERPALDDALRAKVVDASVGRKQTVDLDTRVAVDERPKLPQP